MSLSEGSEDEISSIDSPLTAKRPRTDTYGASSTTSHGSVILESDEEHQNTAKQNMDIQSIKQSYKIRTDHLRLSQSSVSENCSSANEQYEDRPGIDHEEEEEESDDNQQSHFSLRSSLDNYSDDYNSVSVADQKTEEGYSDKAKQIMSKMGFKPGKGLGKFEHGIVEPVEASTQKGRRGLGLKPSLVGDIPTDLKWSPEDTKATATEQVTWMSEPPSEPLSRDLLEEWLKKGPKKLTVEDESYFVDPQILHGVLNAKNIFDTLHDEDLRNARFRSNPYETIGSVMFLNRAAVKMANIDAIYDFMFTKPIRPDGEPAVDKKELLYFADVCAGPGGFSEYILYRKGWRAKGFGFTLRGPNDFKLSDFYAGTPETFNTYYGAAGDGNVFNPANLSSLKDHVLKQTEDKGVHFLMADGGFSVEGQENLQEVLSKQLYLCQCLAALMLVRPGGHFVVKLFDIFTPFSVGLIYIMYRCFDRVSIHKPVTSRPANSERYLVCKWKKLCIETEPAEQHLFSVNSILWNEREQGSDVTQLVPLEVFQDDKQFYQYIYNSNCIIGEIQIKNLTKIAEFSKDKMLKDVSQAEMREQCLQLWQLPDKVRTQPERQSPDDILYAILSSMTKPPPEIQSPITFKNSLLGKQPEYLDNVDNLKHFKSVYDWHFTFLSSGKSSPDLRFFIGCGGKQVYQLEGIKWKNVVDLQVAMPARTLIYGEVVKEYRGEGNTQLYSKALHVIDALMLGGIDISNLPLTERLNQCSLFCTALDKPFNSNVLPIRCKRYFNMESFSSAMNHLEYRVMKRIKRAVTFTITNRISHQEVFHVIGSLLFIKEIKEPWESRLSKSSGHKYYFGIGKDNKPRSEYYIPEAARLDMISAFRSRVQWPWEPASAVLEGTPHSGLTRSQLEDYITSNINR